MSRILIIEDEPEDIQAMTCSVKNALGTGKHDIDNAQTIEEVNQLLKQTSYDIIISDLDLHGDSEAGMTLLKKLRLAHNEVPYVLLTRFFTPILRADALANGATACYKKASRDADIFGDAIKLMLDNRAISERLKLNNPVEDSLEKQIEFEIPGNTKATNDFRLNLADCIRDINAFKEGQHGDKKIVLHLDGDPGTGKSHLASHIIRRLSLYRDAPFEKVPSGSPIDTLFQTQVFGSRPGACPGVGYKKGFLETANYGMIFFDEIGKASEMFQKVLIEFFRDRRFRPLGGDEILFEGFIITAANENLRANTSGIWPSFAQRLNNVLRIPSLKERREDIPAIAAKMLKEMRPLGGLVVKLDLVAEKVFANHDYTSNLAELSTSLWKAYSQVKSRCESVITEDIARAVCVTHNDHTARGDNKPIGISFLSETMPQMPVAKESHYSSSPASMSCAFLEGIPAWEISAWDGKTPFKQYEEKVKEEIRKKGILKAIKVLKAKNLQDPTQKVNINENTIKDALKISSIASWEGQCDGLKEFINKAINDRIA